MEQEIDWLVAGSGAAGLSSAVVAHQLGGSVLVVEKESRYGGTTARSGGVVWIPANHRQPAFGIDDSPAEGLAYLRGLIGDSVSAARLRAYAERAPEMLRFMMRHSHIEYTPLPGYMDYYEAVPGYKAGGRSMDAGTFNLKRLGAEAAHMRDDHQEIMPFNITVQEGRRLQQMNVGAYLLGACLMLRYLADIPSRWAGRRDRRATLGPALIAKLRRSLMDRNIPLWRNTPMTELLCEVAPGGRRVIGACVERDGVSIALRARKGVLLATGGYACNAALRAQYQRPPTSSKWTAAAPGATGDGILLGQAVGAALAFMQSAWWTPSCILPDGRTLALISGKAYPGSILVNRQGRRFTNEAQPYEDVVKDMYAAESRGEGAIPCYLVFDARFRRHYMAGNIKPGKIEADSKLPPDYFSSGMLTRAPTLLELAGRLGIDGPALEKTVARFNRYATAGEDPDFGRGRTLHDRYYADRKARPNPSLGPLRETPFYALRCEAGDLDTKGGLDCNEHGQVLDRQQQVIAGLYAAGNTSAAVMGDSYPGAGATIGSAMTFAYIAARHAFAADQ